MRIPRSLLAALVLLLFTPSAGAQTPSTEGDVLLVANKNGNSLFVVDASSFEVTDSLSTGENPHEVAANSDSRRAYVANYGDGTITVIDVDRGTVIDQWQLDGYDRPHGIQMGPDGEHVYVTAETKQAVLELDASTGSVLRSFKTGKQITHMLAVTPDGEKLFATSIGSGTVSKIDLVEGQVVSHIETGEGAEGVAIREGEVWVTNRADDTVSVLDANTEEVTHTLDVEGFPIRVAIQAAGTYAIVSAPRAGEVAIFDAPEQRLVTRLDVGSKPIGVVTDPNNHAFVASTGSDVVRVINLETLQISDTIEAGRGPDGMAYVPAN